MDTSAFYASFTPVDAHFTAAEETSRRLVKEASDLATSNWRGAGKRELSLVDCSSLAAMRHMGIRRIFASHAHFTRQGFEVIP